VDGERIGQGRDNARTYLEQHPDLMQRIEQKLLLHHGIGTAGASATPNVNAPGSEAPKPTGKGEAAGHAATAEARGAGNGHDRPAAPGANNPNNPNVKRGNVRPS